MVEVRTCGDNLIRPVRRLCRSSQHFSDGSVIRRCAGVGSLLAWYIEFHSLWPPKSHYYGVDRAGRWVHVSKVAVVRVGDVRMPLSTPLSASDLILALMVAGDTLPFRPIR